MPPWGFTGEWHDPAGLVYLRARWYSPALGRFGQVDPVAGDLMAPATQHAYGYGLNSPLLYRDPSGRYIFEAEPTDPWHVADPRVRSRYWYTQPRYEPKGPSDAEALVAMTAPLWVPAAVVAAGAVAEGLGCGVAWLRYLPQSLASESIWRLAPLARGAEAERVLGRSPSLAHNFPHIDRWINNVATSIKTIDLNAPTYQNINNLTRTVMGYIDDLAAWQGQRPAWGGTRIHPSEIARRVLELAVPLGSPAQMGVLQSLQHYARSAGVTLSIVIIR